MHFEDLCQVAMIDAGEHVRAIGWLHHEHPFAEGAVPAALVDRLWEFARRAVASTEALGWERFRGLHRCEFCRAFHSSGNLGIPAGDLLYVAPEMVAHYVEQHRYRPPEEFQIAVMHAPLPDTAEYRELVAPFRKKYIARTRKRALQAAADWARNAGATDDAIRQAAEQFLADSSAENCAQVRAAMTGRQ